MTNEVTTGKKNRKRKGLIAIILCCALVAVVAIAAFNATKTANVQLITVGNISVSLVDSDNVEITDDLEFTGFEGEDTAIIYNNTTLTLESFYVVNNSDAAITFTITITEPTINSTDNIMTWSTAVGGSTYTGAIELEAGATSEEIVVTGTAGSDISEYAGTALDDIMVITVTATVAE